jgi:acyl carrier protein
MFSKATDEWETPQAFFDALDAEDAFEWRKVADVVAYVQRRVIA